MPAGGEGLGPIALSVFKFYFASHIPATILLDAPTILPKSIVPKFCTDICSFYCDTFKDPLFISPPLWFKALIFCEATMQLPFFFVALYALQNRRSWIRYPAICYAAHTATTLVPILANHMLSPDVPDAMRLPLVLLFAPYLLIPLWLMFSMCKSDPFPPPSSGEGRKAK